MPTKKKPTHMIPFDRNKNAALYYDGDKEKFMCVIGYQPLDSGNEYSFDEEFAYDHPLEALTHYEGTFAPGIRPRFGDWLEGIGYHRYNGKKLGFEESPPPQQFHRSGAHCDNCRYGDNGSGTCPARHNKVRCANGTPIDPGREE